MATRSTKKTMKKKSASIYPVARKGAISLDGSIDTNAMIRVDRALSGRNHRLYRQSRCYTVKVDLDVNAAAGQVVEVYAIANTWMASKAYKLAYKMFEDNSKEERAQLGNQSARWNDFRVDHGLGTAFQKDLLFAGATPGVSGLDKHGTGTEYVMSEVAIAGGSTVNFRWTGSATGTFNIIDEYDRTGNTSTSPSTPAGANVAYDGLTDELDDNQMDHLSEHGNEPPYAKDTIENSIWVKVATLSVNAAGQQKLSTGFFEAPAGLVVVQSTVPLQNDSSVLNLECKAGDYKGVHAPSMLE